MSVVTEFAETMDQAEVGSADAKTLIRRSGLFDPLFYAYQLGPGVDARTGLDHFAEKGHCEGYSPFFGFDTIFYRNRHLDGVPSHNPLVHYILEGAAAGLDTEAALSGDLIEMVRILADSDRFDAPFYNSQLATTQTLSKEDACRHYVIFGSRLGLRPNCRFDDRYYRRRSPDVVDAGLNPFYHYLIWGEKEGRSASPSDDGRSSRLEAADDLLKSLFDDAYYVEAFPACMKNHVDPFLHFMNYGWKMGVNPNSALDVRAYCAKNEDVDWDAIHPFRHAAIKRVTTNGRWAEELERMSSISQLFDADFYATQLGDAPSLGLDPLEHYFFVGRHRGWWPNAIFDPIYYASALADLPPADAALHYCSCGYKEGLDPHPLFDEIYYNTQVDNDGLPGAVHFLQTDTNKAVNPSPLFDCRFYMERYMSPGCASGNPLVDFLTFDGAQRRDPNPWFDSRWYRERYAVFDDIPILDYLRCARRAVVRDPNELFDGAWYLQVNEDARDAADPLRHYILQGRFAARSPSPRFDPVWYAGHYKVPDATALAHFLTLGRHIGHLPRPIDKYIHDCDALEIPYVLLRQPESLAGKKVVLMVTHSTDGRTKGYVRRLVGAYRRQAYDVVLIIAADGVACLDEDLEAWTDGVLLRTNHGWDFAAWSVALSCLPDVWKADRVILTNDSLYGPLSDEILATCLSRCEASDAAISIMTDSFQVKYHYMSFFTFLSKKALASPDLRRFWSGIRSNVNKDVVIFEYEVRSAERFGAFGLSVQVLFPASESGGDRPINPTLDAWRELVAGGFPFLKRQLVRQFGDAPRSRGWRAMTPAALREEIESDLATLPSEGPTYAFPLPKPGYLSPNQIKTFYGAVQSVRPAAQSDLVLQIPFDPALRPDAPRARKILVHAHIFHTEMADEIVAYLSNIPIDFDLVITTDSRSKVPVLERVVREHGRSADIRIVPNRGRDIAPLFVALGEDLRSHDVVLHVHSKKSPHNSEYAGWRDYLLESLLGSQAKCASILALLDLADVGMVYPQHFPAIRHLLNYGGNFPIMRRLAARLGFELSTDLVLEFPSGSFFWARTAALRPLLALNLGWDDFSDEAGQVDGTTAHALERLLIHATEAAKYKWVKVGDIQRLDDGALVRPQKLLGLRGTVDMMQRPILWNPIMSRKEKNILDEYNPLLYRPEACERPRLNLFLPTLTPEKIFGGALTALQVFNSLVEAAGRTIDARIIISSEPVRLTGMLSLQGYRLCPMSDTSDFSRIVVDASEHQRGYLPVRPNDIFVATAWWTFLSAKDARHYQEKVHGSAHDLVYLVQDYEAAFYPWSYRHSLASGTLAEKNVVGIVNSEELANAIAGKLGFRQTYVMRYRINEKLASSLRQGRREKILLFYGRPSVDRNAFDAVQTGIAFWTARHPVEADGWRIVSVGESFARELWRGKADIEILGKLALDEYGDLLGRALVGISLMISPHPSYPPLEMAAAGLTTITNSFEGKDLRSRSDNIVTIRDLRPETVGGAIAAATSRRASDAGQYGAVAASLHDLRAPFAAYEPSHLLEHFRRALSPLDTRLREDA